MPEIVSHTPPDAVVGISELRQNFGTYFKRVKDGETLIITKRGREIARFAPTPTTTQHPPAPKRP